MKAYYIILVLYFIAVNVDAKKKASPDSFNLGPFGVKGPIDNEVHVPKYDPLDPDDVIASETLLTVTKSLEKINNVLAPFDPVHIPNIPISVPLDGILKFIAGPLEVNNLVIKGIKDGRIDNLELRKKKIHGTGLFRVDVDASAPEVTAEFDYSVTAKVIFKITVSGSIKVTFKNIKLLLALQLARRAVTRSEEVLVEMQEGDVDFSVDDLQVDISQKSLGIPNMIENSLVRSIADKVKMEVMQKAGLVFKSELNNYLALVPSQVIKRLL